MKQPNPSVKKLIDFFGGQDETATALGVKQPTVSGWLNGEHGMREINAMKAEKLTKGEVKAADLCPKLSELSS